jgi:hypothetical protein
MGDVGSHFLGAMFPIIFFCNWCRCAYIFHLHALCSRSTISNNSGRII